MSLFPAVLLLSRLLAKLRGRWLAAAGIAAGVLVLYVCFAVARSQL